MRGASYIALLAGLVALPAFAQVPASSNNGLPVLPGAAGNNSGSVAPSGGAPAPMPAAAAMPAQPVADAAPAAAVAAYTPTIAEDGSKVYSFGTAKYSLLFAPAQVEAMKKALTAYESISHEVGTPDFQVPVEVAPQQKVGEPSDYPVFYLSSILYHSADDWTVWLDRARVTPQHNTGELVVTKVTPDRAWFRWTPAYIDAIAARSSGNNFADAKKVANRFADPEMITYKQGAPAVEFSLRPNESFVAGYFHTFEGRLASPKVPGDIAVPQDGSSGPGKDMSPQDASTINSLLGPQSTPNPDGADRANMQQLIENQSKITPKSIDTTN